MISKIWKFIKRVGVSAFNGVIDTIIGIIENWEMTIILLAAAAGISYVAGMVPFMLPVYRIIETLPTVIGVGMVWILTRSIKYRLSY